jgi:membrane protease YdiL (CAAX protease family)
MRWLAAEVRGVLGFCSPSACFGLALASAVGEEVFFRGAMQPAVGLGLTSLAFGIVHVGPDRRFLLWTAFASVLGLGLGWLLEWTGSLLGCILAHFTINFLNLLQIMRLGSRGMMRGSSPDAWHGRCCGPVQSPDTGRDD